MHKAGRYLGWKWRNDGFREVMERELVRMGVADEPSTLPGLVGSKVKYSSEKISKIVEFRRLFSFSSVRW